MSVIRVLLADDHVVMRSGLRALLAAEPDIEVVGEADDGLECVQKAMDLSPDVIIMDINMPQCNGLEALEKLQQECSECRVLVLTMHDDLDYLRQVLALGGAGYVLKQAAGEELLSAIRTVHDGGVFLHPDHARDLVSGQSAGSDGNSEPEAQDDLRSRFQSLSPRESEVFRLLALGHRNSEIASSMFLSVKTVETYKSRLMGKLNINSRAALVRLALELGVLG